MYLGLVSYKLRPQQEQCSGTVERDELVSEDGEGLKQRRNQGAYTFKAA